MNRKPFTTTIEYSLQKAFKDTCKTQNENMNDVLEAFMESYLCGEFEIEKTTKCKLIHKGVKG